MSVGILFITNVNPSMSSTPFAIINDVSYFTMEKEILFSMQTIFRINDIKPSGTNDRLWYIHLTLTNDSDQQLNDLIERIRVEIQGPSALYRLGTLMVKLALEIFVKKRPPIHPLLATSYNNIGLVYANMKNYSEAVASYKRAVEIEQQALPARHASFEVYKQNIESSRKKGK
ncbi:unnamed protein product [Rotaria sp. Silwood2]|nr:unnamed protein product [Rotaria sp. Silwood2]